MVKVQATLLLITDSADDWVIFYSNEMHNCQASNEIFSRLLSQSDVTKISSPNTK